MLCFSSWSGLPIDYNHLYNLEVKSYENDLSFYDCRFGIIWGNLSQLHFWIYKRSHPFFMYFHVFTSFPHTQSSACCECTLLEPNSLSASWTKHHAFIIWVHCIKLCTSYYRETFHKAYCTARILIIYHLAFQFYALIQNCIWGLCVLVPNESRMALCCNIWNYWSKGLHNLQKGKPVGVKVQ